MAPLPPPSSGISASPGTLSVRSASSSILQRARSLLTTRDTTVAIPATYKSMDNSPSPGLVVGIVFGSVAGFLFLLYLIYLAFGLSGRSRSGAVYEEEVIRTTSPRSPRKTKSTSHRRRSTTRRSEVIEVSRSRTPPTRRTAPPPRERIVVEERRTSMPAPPPPPMEEDIVEVIEEHSTPPQSRVGGARRTRDSGYRHVDPDGYAGRSSRRNRR